MRFYIAFFFLLLAADMALSFEIGNSEELERLSMVYGEVESERGCTHGSCENGETCCDGWRCRYTGRAVPFMCVP
uniref:U6-agatoxin-Ao1a n=1 Tax=Agelena orientalis TaxID=293813 RepID=TXAG6_AGEOR|nr:RecName: Full=U6-agatoxin-Ao1a; Short=U6-AGTX-Ao1a; AltName: Full=AgorTX_A4; Flags: Precursor [Agelena orientalis]AAU93680.1 toxin-like structure AgorTX_A4 precursor [Agelena orientalis]